MSQNALRDYLDHALAEIGAKDGQQPPAALYLPRFPQESSSPTRSCTACRRTSPRWSSGIAT